jgi:hypothetical protein
VVSGRVCARGCRGAEQEMVSSSVFFVSRVPLVDESSSTTQVADDNDAAAKVVQLDCFVAAMLLHLWKLWKRRFNKID